MEKRTKRHYNCVKGMRTKETYAEIYTPVIHDYPIRVIKEFRHLTPSSHELLPTYRYIHRKCYMFEKHIQKKHGKGARSTQIIEWYNDNLDLRRVHKFVFECNGDKQKLVLMVTYEESEELYQGN